VEDIEGEDRERRFRLHRSKSSGEEPSAAGHPLNRPERMLNRTSSDGHQAGVRMDALLHPIERALIDEPMDRALGGWRAAWL
jgi:hypothetical protein